MARKSSSFPMYYTRGNCLLILSGTCALDSTALALKLCILPVSPPGPVCTQGHVESLLRVCSPCTEQRLGSSSAACPRAYASAPLPTTTSPRVTERGLNSLAASELRAPQLREQALRAEHIQVEADDELRGAKAHLRRPAASCYSGHAPWLQVGLLRL